MVQGSVVGEGGGEGGEGSARKFSLSDLKKMKNRHDKRLEHSGGRDASAAKMNDKVTRCLAEREEKLQRAAEKAEEMEARSKDYARAAGVDVDALEGDLPQRKVTWRKTEKEGEAPHPGCTCGGDVCTCDILRCGPTCFGGEGILSAALAGCALRYPLPSTPPSIWTCSRGNTANNAGVFLQLRRKSPHPTAWSQSLCPGCSDDATSLFRAASPDQPLYNICSTIIFAQLLFVSNSTI